MLAEEAPVGSSAGRCGPSGKAAFGQVSFVAALKRLAVQRDTQARPVGYRYNPVFQQKRPTFDHVIRIPAEQGLTGTSHMLDRSAELEIRAQ